MSPNYPGRYDNEMDCRWLIRAPIHNIVRLNFVDFKTTSADELFIYEGGNVHSNVLKRLSGTILSDVFPSNGNVLYLRFRIEDIHPGYVRGFKVEIGNVGN